jgi:heat shock protein HtpX
MTAVSDQTSRNRRRATVLVAAHVLVITVVVGGLSAVAGLGLAGLLVGLVVAGATAAAAYRWSDALVLRTSRAVPADPVEHARLHNLVEGLGLAGGFSTPRILVIDDPAPNAFATGRSPKHAAVVVTTGLLDTLDRVELEAVLAHLLSHIRTDDVSVATLAVTLVAWPVLVADLLVRRRWWNGGRLARETDRPDAGAAIGSVGVALLGLSAPVAHVLGTVVDAERVPAADRAGLLLTRYPPALISALEKLAAEPTAVHAGLRSTAHLWIVPPLALDESEGHLAVRNRPFVIHPDTTDRLDVLREL